MTNGGIIVMILSVGAATIFFLFCLYHVLKALKTDGHLDSDTGEDVNLDDEANRNGADESTGK